MFLSVHCTPRSYIHLIYYIKKLGANHHGQHPAINKTKAVQRSTYICQGFWFGL